MVAGGHDLAQGRVRHGVQSGSALHVPLQGPSDVISYFNALSKLVVLVKLLAEHHWVVHLDWVLVHLANEVVHAVLVLLVHLFVFC